MSFLIQLSLCSRQPQLVGNANGSFMLNGSKALGKRLFGKETLTLLIHNVLSVYTALSER